MVGLVILVYSIPIYASKRMRILNRRMGLEEEKIEITQHQLEHEDKVLSEAPVTASADAEKKA